MGRFRFAIFFLLLQHFSGSRAGLTDKIGPKLNQRSKDPLGMQDSFASLPASDQSLWDFSHGPTFGDRRATLQKLSLATTVDIRLVGFDGEGMDKLFLSPAEVAWHLRSLKPEIPLIALQRLSAELWAETKLGVSAKMVYQVSKTRPGICQEIAEKIKAAIAKEEAETTRDGSGMIYISHEVVDEVIARDYVETRKSYSVYILSPKIESKYMYFYRSRDGCPGTLWTSTNQRYFWIDLTAGPGSYGPVGTGEGKVLSHSIPRAEHYDQAHRSKAILPDITALIYSGVKHLVVPSCMNIQKNDWVKTIVHMVHIHDTLSPSRVVKEVSEYEQLQKELQRVMLPGQAIELQHSYVAFGHCSPCVAAYSRSLRTHSERMPGAGMNIATTTHLASDVLHGWLSDEDLQMGLTDNTGKPLKLALQQPNRVLPVFIFEISSLKSLTLDGKVSVESFPDMVIGVRTFGGSTSSGYACGEKKIAMDTGNIYRPLLASLLSTGWGVLDTAQYVGTDSEEVQLDYTWSVGNTVFGNLAKTLSLSFSQEDIAKRNMILSTHHELVSRTDAILRGFANISAQHVPDAFANKADVLTFYQRFNVLMYKLDMSLQSLGSLRFDEAWYFSRSAKADVTALYKLARSSSEATLTSMVCMRKRGGLRIWILAFLGVTFGVFFGLLRRFRPKKKQF